MIPSRYVRQKLGSMSPRCFSMHEPALAMRLKFDATCLKELRITDFALVDSAIIEFGPGLNCITGESGSGKSVMVDALNLISGAPTPLSDCIRGSATQATIEGVYSLDACMARTVRELLTSCGLSSRALPCNNDEGSCELVIRREIVRGAPSASTSSTGPTSASAVRSKTFINGSATSLKVLKDLGSILLDANVQNSASELKDPETQLELLDKVAGTSTLATQIKTLVAECKRLEDSLSQLDELDDEEEREAIQSMIDACRRIKMKRDEEIQLRQSLKNIEGRRNSAEQCGSVRKALTGDGGSSSGFAQAIRALEVQLSVVMKQEIQMREAEALAAKTSSSNGEEEVEEEAEEEEEEEEDQSDESSLSSAGEAALEALQSAREQLGIAEGHVRTFSRMMQFDPSEYSRLTERLRSIEKVLKAFSCKSSYQLMKKVEEAEQRLASFHEAEEHQEEWEARLGELTGEIRSSVIELSRRRRAAAALMGPSVQSCLAELAMSQSRFQVNIKWSPSSSELPASQGVGSIPVDVAEEFGLGNHSNSFKFSSSGSSLDSVSFMLASGPHEPLKSLASVASGGEAARIVLSLKAAPSLLRDDSDQPSPLSSPILVLDELDSSIGARLGSVVGKILRRMVEGRESSRSPLGSRSRDRQIICVTHLPQVAAYADQHVRVRKFKGGESSEEMRGARVKTVFECLATREQRTNELADMLGLDQDIAAEMLRNAE